MPSVPKATRRWLRMPIFSATGLAMSNCRQDLIPLSLPSTECIFRRCWTFFSLFKLFLAVGHQLTNKGGIFTVFLLSTFLSSSQRITKHLASFQPFLESETIEWAKLDLKALKTYSPARKSYEIVNNYHQLSKQYECARCSDREQECKQVNLNSKDRQWSLSLWSLSLFFFFHTIQMSRITATWELSQYLHYISSVLEFLLICKTEFYSWLHEIVTLFLSRCTLSAIQAPRARFGEICDRSLLCLPCCVLCCLHSFISWV